MKPCMRPLRTQWACALIASRRIAPKESNVNESAFWNNAVMSVDKFSAPPPAPPPPIPHGLPITLELAKRVAAAAEAEAGKNGWPMAIAIAEPTGALVYFLKMDDVQYASIELAMIKAKTAAVYRRPTKMFTEALGNGHLMFLTFPDLCAAPGGLPLVADGKLIGAIGVSGGAGHQDDVVAQAGVAAL
jgi:glc operon protein GlcG